MKITGKNKKISPFLGLYISACLLVFVLPTRVYQLLNIIESETGFYRIIDYSVYIMYAIIIIAVIVAFLTVTLAKNIPASKSPFRKNKFLALTSLGLGVGIMLDVVNAASDFIINAKNFTQAGLSFLGTADQGQIPLLAESVLGVFAAIYLMVFGFSYIDGRTTYSQYKFLAITPFFWSMSRLVIRLITKISYINISDLMLEIFGLAFMMMFFMSFARISSGLSNNKAMRSLFSTGVISAFLLSVADIPRLLLLLSGNGKKITVGYGFSVCDFVFIFFTVAYMVNAYKCAKENDSKELLAVEEKTALETDMEIDDNFLSE